MPSLIQICAYSLETFPLFLVLATACSDEARTPADALLDSGTHDSRAQVDEEVQTPPSVEPRDALRDAQSPTLDAAIAPLRDAGAPLDAAGWVSDTSLRDASTLDATLPWKFEMRGAEVYLVPQGDASLYVESCANAAKLEKQSTDGGWTSLVRDIYSSSESPGYYLNGKYVPPSFNFGCDVGGCQAIAHDTRFYAGSAREYVQTGTKPIPVGYDAGTSSSLPAPENPARVVEIRAVSGPIRASVTLSFEPTCKVKPETVVEVLDLPHDGVCCPLGNTGCGSIGPLGGWARNTSECGAEKLSPDLRYVRSQDEHGCPVLAFGQPIECRAMPAL